MSKQRCQRCDGRGGWFIRTILGEGFKPCLQCLGKGAWYPNAKPKPKRKAGRR